MKKRVRLLAFPLVLLLLCSSTMSVSATTPPIRKYMHGDADGDGQITTTDARLVLQSCVGKGSCFRELVDVDWDGEVTTTDARLILQYSVGKRVYTCIGQELEWEYPIEGMSRVKKPPFKWNK